MMMSSPAMSGTGLRLPRRYAATQPRTTGPNPKPNLQTQSAASGSALPAGWGMADGPDGSTFFIDHTAGTSSWIDPRTALGAPPSRGPRRPAADARLVENYLGGLYATTARSPPPGVLKTSSLPHRQPRARRRIGWRQVVTVYGDGSDQREYHDLMDSGTVSYKGPDAPQSRLRRSTNGTIRAAPPKQWRFTPRFTTPVLFKRAPRQSKEAVAAGQVGAGSGSISAPGRSARHLARQRRPTSAETSEVAPIVDSPPSRQALPRDTDPMSNFEYAAAALGPTPSMDERDAAAAEDGDASEGNSLRGARRRSSLDLGVGAAVEAHRAPRRRLRCRRHSVDVSVLFRRQTHPRCREGEVPRRLNSRRGTVSTPGFRDSAPPTYNWPPAYAIEDGKDALAGEPQETPTRSSTAPGVHVA